MNPWQKFKQWWYAPVLKRLDEDDGPSFEFKQWQASESEAADLGLPVFMYGLTQPGHGTRIFMSRQGLKSAFTQLGRPEDARPWRARIAWEETVEL